MKKIYLLVITLFLVGLGQEMFGQVGFNNPNPDPSSVIDVKSTDKGILIPRMTTGERNAMAIGTETAKINQALRSPNNQKPTPKRMEDERMKPNGRIVTP